MPIVRPSAQAAERSSRFIDNEIRVKRRHFPVALQDAAIQHDRIDVRFLSRFDQDVGGIAEDPKLRACGDTMIRSARFPGLREPT